jgi:uncharacterized lipoprotein YajG
MSGASGADFGQGQQAQGIHMKRIGKAAWAAGFAALCLSGCATQEDVVPVPYKVHGGAQTGAGHAVALTVTDARTQDRTKIANKSNAYGMEMAAIRADRAVTAIVQDAFEAELKSRGFSIGGGGANASVAINRFYTTFQAQGAMGDVKLHVSVTPAGGAEIYDREIDVMGIEPSVFWTVGNNASAALSDGMSKAFDVLFSDPAFLAALEKGGSSSDIKAGS